MTAADQKRQWSELSAMGIQVPDAYRGEMAMASNWQTVSKPRHNTVPEEDSLSKGIRKRKIDEDEEEDQVIFQPSRKVWGKSTKVYPGQVNDDLDALLSSRLPLKREKVEVKEELSAPPQAEVTVAIEESDSHQISPVTDNEGVATVEGAKSAAEEASNEGAPPVKMEPSASKDVVSPIDKAPVPVFKKRKGKATATANAI